MSQLLAIATELSAPLFLVLLVCLLLRTPRAPWGTYVSRSESRLGGIFMTVRHHWRLPRFGTFERVYHREPEDPKSAEFDLWSEELTGEIPCEERQVLLRSMYIAAKSRDLAQQNQDVPLAKVIELVRCDPAEDR